MTRTAVAKRESVFQVGGVTTQLELTPTAKAFYKDARALQALAARMKCKRMSDRKKMNFLSTRGSLLSYLKDMNEITFIFFMSQLRTQKLKTKCRRFSFDDKIFAHYYSIE